MTSPLLFTIVFLSEPLCIVYYYRTFLEKHKCLNTRFSCWKEKKHKEGKLRKQQQRTIISTENICQAFIYGCLKSREKSFRLSFFIALSISTPSRASSASNNFVFPLIFFCVYVRSTEEIIWWYFLHKKLRRETFSLLFFLLRQARSFFISLRWIFIFWHETLCSPPHHETLWESVNECALKGRKMGESSVPCMHPRDGEKNFSIVFPNIETRGEKDKARFFVLVNLLCNVTI